MIDKIKLRLENAIIGNAGLDKFGSPSINKNDCNVVVRSRFMYYDKDFNPSDEEITINEEFKHSKECLKISLATNLSSATSRLYIRGNIRKWYMTSKSTRDFKRKDFVGAIALLEKELGLTTNTLWNAAVTQIEIGVRLRLKDRHRGLLFCIAHYKNFKKLSIENEFDEFKKLTVSNETVKFIGEKYSILFYDKIKEVFNHSEMKKTNGKKASKNNFYLRYELQIKSVSHMRPSIKDNISTLLLIRNNWKSLGEILKETLEDIVFVDILSPISYDKIKLGAKTEIKNYLMCEGMKSVGIDNFLNLINVIENKKRGEYRNEILAIYEDYIRTNKKATYKKYLTRKLGKRISALS